MGKKRNKNKTLNEQPQPQNSNPPALNRRDFVTSLAAIACLAGLTYTGYRVYSGLSPQEQETKGSESGIEQLLQNYAKECGIDPKIARVIHDPNFEHLNALCRNSNTLSLDKQVDANGLTCRVSYTQKPMDSEKVQHTVELYKRTTKQGLANAVTLTECPIYGSGKLSTILIFSPEEKIRADAVRAKAILSHEYTHAKNFYNGITIGNMRINKDNFQYFAAIALWTNMPNYERITLLKAIDEMIAISEQLNYLQKNGGSIKPEVSVLYANLLDIVKGAGERSDKVFADFDEKKYCTRLAQMQLENPLFSNIYQTQLNK